MKVEMVITSYFCISATSTSVSSFLFSAVAGSVSRSSQCVWALI